MSQSLFNFDSLLKDKPLPASRKLKPTRRGTNPVLKSLREPVTTPQSKGASPKD